MIKMIQNNSRTKMKSCLAYTCKNEILTFLNTTLTKVKTCYCLTTETAVLNATSSSFSVKTKT